MYRNVGNHEKNIFQEIEPYKYDRMVDFEEGIACECLGLYDKAISIYRNVSDETTGLPVIDALTREYGSRDAAIDALIDKKSKDYASIAYLDDSEKADKLFENQLKLMKQPICRNGKNAATVGLAQKTWETWK